MAKSRKVLWFVTLVLFILASQPAYAKNYKAAEIRTTTSYKYGRFEMRMLASNKSGILSTMFTFNDDNFTTPQWNELDVEVLGLYNDRVQFNAITYNHTMHEHIQMLGTDPTKCFIVYAVEWTPSYVAWFIDGAEVYRDSGSHIAELTFTQKFMLNHWATNLASWAGAFDPASLPAYAYYDYASYYSYTPGSGNYGTGNNFTLQWKDDFDTFNTSRWQAATHTFAENECDFIPQNAVIKNGYLVLAITDQYNTGFNGTIPAGCVPSATITRTRTRTATPVITATFTSTGTATSTKTGTATSTKTGTATSTKTGTATSTKTVTATSTKTGTPTNTITGTPTCTITGSTTGTSTHTQTPAPPTATYTNTVTRTYTRTAEATSTHTSGIFTPTFTVTGTYINTVSPSSTYTETATQSQSPTLTVSPVNTATHTATPSLTNTTVPSMTATAVESATFTAVLTTATFTLTVVPSFTATRTSTPTLLPTGTQINTMTATRTAASSFTATPTFTAVFSGTMTLTPSPMPTGTATAVPTAEEKEKFEIVDVILFPNPVSQHADLMVKFDVTRHASMIHVRIYTTSFRLVIDQAYKGYFLRDTVLTLPKRKLGGLSAGSYYISVYAEDGPEKAYSKPKVAIILK